MDRHETRPYRPSFGRVLLGFLIAPGIGAVVGVAIWLLFADPHMQPNAKVIFLILLTFGYLFAWLLGIPAYFLLRAIFDLNPVSGGLLGTLIAAMFVISGDMQRPLGLAVAITGVIAGTLVGTIAVVPQPKGRRPNC